MNNTNQLLKCIISEMSDSEWKGIREDLTSSLPHEDHEVNGADGETGLSDREAILIRKLARKTEELYRIFRDDNGEDPNKGTQE